MPPKRGPDRVDQLVARLAELRERDRSEAIALAIHIISRERVHRAIEPALALLREQPTGAARAALVVCYHDLAAHDLRMDQGCALRTGIVRVLRAMNAAYLGPSDDDLAVAGAALRTVQRLPPSMIDVAQGLRAEGLMLMTEVDPTQADYRAVELLHDPHRALNSGEPTVSAVRVLAARGHTLPIWAMVRQPDVHPEAFAQVIASSRGVPRILLRDVLIERLTEATKEGELGEAIALVAAEAIIEQEITEGYDLVIDLLRTTVSPPLAQFLAGLMVRRRESAFLEAIRALSISDLVYPRVRATLIEVLRTAR